MTTTKVQKNTQKPVDRLPLSDLELDIRNPRFGESAGDFSTQADVVDWIVERFGVDDVLSSLSINGYFDAEPLIVSQNPSTKKFIVKEGNRRLAACLILAKDPRAKNHWKKADAIHQRGHGKGWSSSTLIPVIKFVDSESQELLSYLGVRHIVSSQPWDSYAKANWISTVIANGQLTLDDIAEVTGDKNKTIARLLEGYNFVKQLIAAGHFDPKSSMRRGRGSNVSYPFSWVYTLLGYGPVREWLSLSAGSSYEHPIPPAKLDEAALTLRCMFGDKAKSISPAISDSRQIGDLAVALGNTQKRSLLKSGYTISQIEEESQPIADRISTHLLKARDSLRDANGLLAEHDVGAVEAEELIEIVRSIRKQASETFRTLNAVLNEDDDE
jgi:hypothetical protein